MNDPLSLPDRVARHVREIPRSGIRDFFDIVTTMHDVISLGVGEPDFDTPWHVREAAIYAIEHGATHYTSNLGLLKLRKAISGYVERTFGVRYDPETEVLVTVGVSEAMDLAVRCLVEPGDEVLYHDPAYVSYSPLVTFAHGRPVAVPTDFENGFRLQPDRLAAAVNEKTRLLLLNYPNNPTGATLPRNSLEEVAAIVRDRDLLVVSDEIYAELTYPGPHTCLAALPGMRDRTLLLHGFSKAWAMTGFRMGYACGPAPLIAAMMKIHQYSMLCAPILSQEASIEALKQPERDIAEMRTEYDRRRHVAQSAFEAMGVPCHKPGGAFYIFPRISEFGLSPKDFALRLLDEERVAVVPGTAFGACGDGHIRCSYATALDDLQEAMERIARFVKRLRG